MPEPTRLDGGECHRKPALERLRVGEAMHWGVITCSPTARLPEVAAVMAAHRVHCAIVPTLVADRDGTLTERAWGVVTDRRLLAAAGTTSADSAADLASTDVPIAQPEWSLAQAARLMTAHATAHLVVVDDLRHPIGVLSTLDVVRAIAAANAFHGARERERKHGPNDRTAGPAHLCGTTAGGSYGCAPGD